MTKRKKLFMRAIAITFLIAVILPTANSLGDNIDDQVREISYLLMCPVCQGQTVEESNSQLAKDMRTIIRKKLEEGQSKEEIIAYFVDKYGETILGAPPAKGSNWILWLFPAFALVIGAFGLGIFLYRSKGKESGNVRENSKKALMNVENKYLEKIDQELTKLEP